MKQEQGGNSELVRNLEKEIIQIIETDSDFVIGPFPLDKDIRNYELFLNSYRMEKHRRDFEAYRNTWMTGAYVNGQIGYHELMNNLFIW